MKILLLIVSIISLNFTFAQSGSGGGGLGELFKNSSVTIGMNQFFYGKDWNELIEDVNDVGTDADKNPFRKLNFTLLNEFEHGLLGGVKYLSYGTDTDFSADSDDYYSNGFSSSQKVELKFLKLFLTYPIKNGLYLGVEGGYFMEGENKIKIQTNSQTNDIDREMWTDADLSEFDYGLLGQFYYNINENLLATVEGYYGLSKFSEDYSSLTSFTANVFHYINLGVTYKFGKKVIE